MDSLVSQMSRLHMPANQCYVRSASIPLSVHILTFYQYSPGLGPLYEDIWRVVLEQAHDCATNTPDPRPLCLVSKGFRELVITTPILWHHIVRRAWHFNPSAVDTRIEYASGAPLILSLEMVHDDDFRSFIPIFRKHQHKWHSIEIQGCSLSQLCHVINGCRFDSLQNLSFLPCEDADCGDPSMGVGISVIKPPRLLYLRLHLVQLHCVRSNTLERLYVECSLSPDEHPLSLVAAFAHTNLTRLLLSDLRADNPLPDRGTTLPRLTALILFNVYAASVRPLLDVLNAPQLHTLAVILDTSSPFSSARVTDNSSPLLGYPRMQLLHLNQSGTANHQRVVSMMLFSLGWAFPSATVLQTNIQWGLIAPMLNPTPADIPFVGKVTVSLPAPFPRIQTIALRDGGSRSLRVLAQSIAFRMSTPHAIRQCGVESHLLDIVRSKLSPGVEVIEWSRDLDATMQPLYPL